MFKIIVFSLCYLFCHILLHVYYMKQQFDFFYKLGIKVKFLAQNIKTVHNYCFYYQRWSPRGRPWPRGHILKSLALALASKVKSLALALASRPQVLENWPVLGSRTALFFGMLKFCGALEKFFGKRFLVEIA